MGDTGRLIDLLERVISIQEEMKYRVDFLEKRIGALEPTHRRVEYYAGKLPKEQQIYLYQLEGLDSQIIGAIAGGVRANNLDEFKVAIEAAANGELQIRNLGVNRQRRLKQALERQKCQSASTPKGVRNDGDS